jgi:hypothetical protein
MYGAVPSLPQYVFLEWCSVEKSIGTTLKVKVELSL